MKLPVGYITGQGLHQATGFGGLGQKMMEQMGWTKGTGLGKEGAGMKEAIVVKKREDFSGVGAGSGWDWEMKFWEKAYNSAVQTVQHKDGSSSSSSDSDDSDVGASTARRAARVPSAVNRDGTVASASAAEMLITAELAKDPWGRWGGRNGKMARIAAQEQAKQAGAAQQLGIPVRRKAATRSSKEEAAAAAADPSLVAGPEDVVATKDGEQRRAKKRRSGAAPVSVESPPVTPEPEPAKVTAPARRVVVVTLPEPEAITQFQPQATAGWWGASMFRSSGCLEGLDKQKQQQQEQRDSPPATSEAQGDDGSTATGSGRAAAAAPPTIVAHAFTEGDQEALYMQLHDKVSKGRSGLGKSGAYKFSGGTWKGNKTTFADDASGLDAVSVAAPTPAACSAVPATSTGVTATDKKQWLKRTRALLKQAPKRRMKLKALGKQLKQLYGDDGCTAQEVMAVVQHQAAKNKKLQLDGKFVCLN